MILTDDYSPAEQTIGEPHELIRFPWPSVGLESIEVYEVDAEGVYTLVSANDYTVFFSGANGFLLDYTGGKVQFTRLYSEGATAVSIQRNTLMTQTVDFLNREIFTPEIIEFALDKHTMILQEIAFRKCEDTGGTPVSTSITQLIAFSAYGQFMAEALSLGLDKLTQISFEITQAKESCENTPELT